jgi:glycosyltransferase involved in cell wall biosynthesis
MKRLRIAVVTPELPNREYPNRGRSVYQTLRHLSGYAELQAFCPLPRYPAHFRPRRFDYRVSDLSYSLPEVSARYFEYPALPVVSRPVNGLICAHYLESHLRGFDADVILNFLLYPAGFAALSVGRKLNVPVVVGSIGSDVNAIPDPVSRWFTRKTLSGASRIIAKSEQLRHRIVAMGVDPEKTHVIPNGCDGNLFFVRDRDRARRELNIPASAELMAFVGRLHRGKGVFELLEAVAALSRKRPNLRLVCVGDGPELEAMQQKVRVDNIYGRVDFPGACSSEEVARWLAAANLLALPSYAEGSPNAVIEALSCGRPVVATRVGDVPELVDHSCGVMIPVGNVAALSIALDATLSSAWDEESIARRFRRSWQQVAQEVFAICEDVCTTAQAQSIPNLCIRAS